MKNTKQVHNTDFNQLIIQIGMWNKKY